ncbi:ADYC domain-containing protein [Sorangium sp. So ce1153]|uniref:ADYC domain-containing protein n=1 Tax=Sorangium sp. So ce1153 TaxID=3133333 RepID=UPI003F62135B
MRISDVAADGVEPPSNARRYKLEVQWPPLPLEGAAHRWVTICKSGYAIAFEGVWDDITGEHRSSGDVLTLACDGNETAAAKCYQQWHYRPWDTGDPKHPKPMSDMHDACVRMTRADYCGDGTSATRDNTIVDVWDAANFNKKTSQKQGHGFEAAWTGKGAVCRNHLRWPALTPECASALPVCDSHEEAEKKGLGDVLLFNTSCRNHPCPDDPPEDATPRVDKLP